MEFITYHTKNLEVVSTMQLSFHESVGDHRTVLVDISTQSMIGKDSFKVVRPQACCLMMANEGAIRRYILHLEQSIAHHRLADQQERLYQNFTEGMSSDEVTSGMEKIDIEVTNAQLASERRCRKIQQVHIPFSLPVKYWVRRKWAFQGLVRLHLGEYTSRSNCLRRACQRTSLNRIA